jgi:transcriptional regulator with XRE-family HTH domain
MTGPELKERRKAAGVNAEKLCEILDIATSSLSNWERGIVKIPRIAEIAVDAVLSRIETEKAAEARQVERQNHISRLAGKATE